ncbi:MAG: DUF5615 family PIN-like protein [Anaerolineae bacterium]|nr:DUF5615 family PIN-like protein [Anaerolineae bacterium]MCX8067759.1 DUF5615 family PIN-like protein [Anaerolineae bacterium]
MSRPRYLLDEHIPRAVQRQLRRRDLRIEVLAIGDPGAPAAGTPDPTILTWIEENGYILITENRRTLPAYLAAHFAAGRHIPGLFWLRPGTSIGEIVEELYLIWQSCTAEEFLDQTLYLPL